MTIHAIQTFARAEFFVTVFVFVGKTILSNRPTNVDVHKNWVMRERETGEEQRPGGRKCCAICDTNDVIKTHKSLFWNFASVQLALTFDDSKNRRKLL